MRSSVVFCLAVSFSVFGFGLSLKCYSCPGGSTSNCGITQDCGQGEDSCLKLTSGDRTYTRCLRTTDCDFMTLAVKFSLPDFEFSCCQSNQCNGQSQSWLDKFKNFFG